MSAFVLSEEAYSSICSAIYTYRDALPKGDGQFGTNLHPRWDADIMEALIWLKRMLLQMNVESVNYRYDETEGLPDYTIDVEPFPDDAETRREKVTEALRYVHSWEYQSCELPNFERWWQWQLMDCLLVFLSRELLKLFGKPIPEDDETCAEEATRLPIYRDSTAWG